MLDKPSLMSLLSDALLKRATFLQRMQQEKTDCYRLFHGSVEGEAGLTVDRYGENLLIQSFHTPLSTEIEHAIADFYCAQWSEIHHVFSHDRSKGAKQSRRCIRGDNTAVEITEAGIRYFCDMAHLGQDPLLFLDFRQARRVIGEISAGKSVLNTFSFSCGMGLSAAVNGAADVTNIDFAQSALAAGKKSLQLNDLPASNTEFIQEDYFLAVRQMAGLSIPVRKTRGMKGIKRYAQKPFDVVVLDPPRWAKSKYGTVDLVRDYNAVLKPALLTVKPGGKLFCTNNVAQVEKQPWIDDVKRCCEKNGRMITDVKMIDADEDFPSFDGRHPLKQLLLTLD